MTTERVYSSNADQNDSANVLIRQLADLHTGNPQTLVFHYSHINAEENWNLLALKIV